MPIEYKVETIAENPLETVIEKTGLTVKFTMQQILDHEVQLHKNVEALTAQLALEKAKLTNIEDNHPTVVAMSEQDLFTAHMYKSIKDVVQNVQNALTNNQTELNQYATEKAAIYAQVPEVKPAEAMVSPMQPIADGTIAETPAEPVAEPVAPVVETPEVVPDTMPETPAQ